MAPGPVGTAPSGDGEGPRRVPVPSPEIQELMMAAAQYTEMAASLRQKGELDRAIRTMERAVGMASKAEYHHPAMAVETARARINLAATLSEAKRHRAALMAIKKAQNTLSRVIAWAQPCSDDPAAHSILEEARTLRCAGLVAESIQMELCPGPSVEPAGSGYDARGGDDGREQICWGGERGWLTWLFFLEPAGPTEQRQAVVKERTDVFSEFLRGREAERVARLGSLNDNWEDQAKRRLGQVHRSTQLALDLMGDEELKEILGSLSCI
ncbi:Putative E3 ubiquitin-protein ligase HERC1 [Durusdinium trenchii]|uniref:E3 ubiquitin-protein ligase HERC1 n=1 Tax=Durusdinium trenchii TaxID=1381693 RepID=A0ABP0JF13_9DINO